MHLNKNTTLELIDSDAQNQLNQASARKNMSPFSVKAQDRKRFVEERSQKVQERILQQYQIEPFNPSPTRLPKAITPGSMILDETNSSVGQSRARIQVNQTPRADPAQAAKKKAAIPSFSEKKH